MPESAVEFGAHTLFPATEVHTKSAQQVELAGTQGSNSPLHMPPSGRLVSVTQMSSSVSQSSPAQHVVGAAAQLLKRAMH